MTTIAPEINERVDVPTNGNGHGDSRGTRPIAIGIDLHRQIDLELVLQDQARGYRITKRAFVEEAVRKYLDEIKHQRPLASETTKP